MTSTKAWAKDDGTGENIPIKHHSDYNKVCELQWTNSGTLVDLVFVAEIPLDTGTSET